jgi:uncharacterized membrane protein
METRKQFVTDHEAERYERDFRRQVASSDKSLVGYETGARHWKQPEANAATEFDGERLARGLGWLSVGLGVLGIMAPHSLARLLGTRNHGILFRIMGLREIATGIGILTSRRTAGWLWARVGGDILDLVALGKAMKSQSAKPANIAAATVAVVGVTALDVCCSQKLSDGTHKRDEIFNFKKTMLINSSPEELYRRWRNFENLPRFMKNLQSVEMIADNRSHWVAKGPAGKKVQWDAEITEDRPNELIAWRSLDGAKVDNSGRVRFEPAPGERGTLVSVEMQYKLPAGKAGATLAKIFGRAPEQEVEEDLRRFKQVMETGEIITTQGQPAGRRSSTSWKYDQTVRRASMAN